jgi:hypothetical protein
LPALFPREGRGGSTPGKGHWAGAKQGPNAGRKIRGTQASYSVSQRQLGGLCRRVSRKLSVHATRLAECKGPNRPRG